MGALIAGTLFRGHSRSELLRSILVTGFPYDLRLAQDDRLRLFNRFMAHARAIRRDGAAALDLCHVAAGRVDAFWEERLQPWDVLAGGLFVEEAGGRVSRFDGSAIGLAADEVLATNGPLHEPMLAVMREAESG